MWDSGLFLPKLEAVSTDVLSVETVQSVGEPLINVEGLVVRYGDVQAVNGLNLKIESGEVVGLLGGNGAGKSSTLRAMSGVNPPTEGVLRIAGHDMGDPKAVELARAQLGYCPDVGGLIREATVREHIGLALAVRGETNLWPQALEMTERFNLLHVLDRVTAGFSHGMCRRLSVMLAAITAKSVLILDEPFDGVDPLGVDVTLGAIQDAKNAGLAVVISTHLIDLIVESCDRVTVMIGGVAAEHGAVETYAGPEGKKHYANLLRGIA